jgi:outer membrane biosynthesis protein TonB
MPTLRFPQGFQERSIEGWAIIGYDIAPWGATGNVRVLAAEPTDMFGEEARSIVTGARQAASQAGRSGCVDIVRFVMPNKKHPGPSDGE